MNVLTVIVLVLFAAFMFNGYRKGFIKVFTSMFFFLLSAALVYMANPYVSQFLKDHTPVYSFVEERVAEGLESSFASESEAKPEADGEVSFLEQKKIIEELEIPEILKQQLIQNNHGEEYQLLNVSGFSKYIASYMSNIILNILSFVVTMILVTLILRFTVMTLDVIANLPILSGLNRILGLVLGFGQGLLAVWFGFLVITIFSQTELGRELMQMISKGPVLSFLYDQNIFLKYLLEAMGNFL